MTIVHCNQMTRITASCKINKNCLIFRLLGTPLRWWRAYTTVPPPRRRWNAVTQTWPRLTPIPAVQHIPPRMRTETYSRRSLGCLSTRITRRSVYRYESSTLAYDVYDVCPVSAIFYILQMKAQMSLWLQEMPEKAPAGQLPRSVDIVVDSDLVDKCKPGDRVQVIGMYRCLPGKKNGYTTGSFRTVLIANNIQQMSKEATPHFTADDIGKIKKFSRQKAVSSLLFAILTKIHIV